MMSVDQRPYEPISIVSNRSEWDVDEIIGDVMAYLDDSVPRATAHQTIVALLADYEHARIKTFVPILVRRRALVYFGVR